MKNFSVKASSLTIAVLALGLGGCASSLVSSVDTADHLDVSEYETYAWIADETWLQTNAAAAEFINPVNHSRIREQINRELASKGYAEAPIAEADFVVSYTLGAQDRVRVSNFYDDFGYGYYGYGRFGRGFNRFNRFNRFGTGIVRREVRTITEGALAVDIFDNEDKQAIWHGSATKSLTNDESGRKLIAEAVDSLFMQFPDRPLAAATMVETMPVM